MSYILDALRRADAERERGVVPSLQSQQHTIADDDARSPARSRVLVWAVAGLGVALIAAVAWNVFGGAHNAAPLHSATEGSVTPLPGAPALLPTSPAVAPQQAAAPTVTAPIAPTPPPATEAAPPRPAAAAAKTRPPSPAQADAKRTARRGSETGGSATARAGQPSANSAGEGRVYKQIELPEDVRRDLPNLTIGGASFSGDAASRMVMINGQVFHEGDRLAPNLVLERIKLKSAVFSYKGYRYEVTF